MEQEIESLKEELQDQDIRIEELEGENNELRDALEEIYNVTKKLI